jgi:hypothetical protein
MQSVSSPSPQASSTLNPEAPQWQPQQQPQYHQQQEAALYAAPAQTYVPQRQPSAKAVQAQQLQNLPHAPQHGLYSFPSVPDLELPAEPQPQRQQEMLIEL